MNELLEWADEIVLSQQPVPDEEALIRASGKPVLWLHGGEHSSSGAQLASLNVD